MHSEIDEKSDAALTALGNDRLVEFVRDFTRELRTLGRERTVYPADHPRVDTRARLLHAEIAEFIARNKVLRIQMRRDLCAINETLVSATLDATEELSDLFYDHRLESVEFKPGVTLDEVRAFVQWITSPPDTIPQLENIELNQLDPFFCKTGPDGELEPSDFCADPKVWRAFSPSQMRTLAVAFSANTIRESLGELSEHPLVQKESADENEFLSRFLGSMKDDPSVDWSDATSVRKLITAGLDLLRDAVQRNEISSAFPTDVDVGDFGEGVMHRFRWKLLRSFFPGAAGDLAPRDGEDFDSAELRPADVPTDDDVPIDQWGRADLDLISREFDDEFKEGRALVQYDTLFPYLADGLTQEQQDDIVKHWRRAVLLELSRTRSPERSARRLARHDAQREPIILRALAGELARLLDPIELVRIFCGDRHDVFEEVQRKPPFPIGIAIELGDPVSLARELLRQVLVRRGRAAQEIAWYFLTSRGLDAPGSDNWRAVFEHVARPGAELDSLIDENIGQIFSPEAAPLIVLFPVESLAGRLRRIVTNPSPEFFLLVRSIDLLAEPRCVPILSYVLEHGSPSLRCAAAEGLGRQRGNDASKALLEHLARLDVESCDSREVRIVALALCRIEPRRGFLTLQRIAADSQRSERLRAVCRAIVEGAGS